MTDVKQIRSRLWNSLEMQNVIRWFFVGVFLTVFLLLMVWLKPMYLPPDSKALILAIMWIICPGPFFIFCLVRTFRIFWKPRGYHFCKTTLSKPKGGNIRHTIRFTVLLEDSDGHKFLADTHSIFFTGGFIGPLLEDYVNQTVTVAHNEETGMLVVIG